MTADDAHPDSSVALTASDHEIARYHDGAGIGDTLSPRPYLHPVRTPAGEVLTEVFPVDHRHHYGMSAAVVDVNGTTYWGGASYVDGTGYVLLPNQGRQVGAEPDVTAADGLTTLQQRVSWQSQDGAEQIDELREIRLAHRGGRQPAHLLTWRSRLRALDDLTIGSPATRGRTGAGYGGLFWRFGPEAGAEVRVTTPQGVVSGEENALGAVGRWLTLTEQRAGGPVTLLLAQPEGELLPWFVRTTGYTGAGPAVAWEHPVPHVRGSVWDLHLWAALLDGDLDPDSADHLYRDLETLAA